MDFDVPQECIELASALADASAAVIRRHFRAPITIDLKADESPVTIADRNAEAAIRELIRRHRPGDGIIGEEHGAEQAGAEWVWVIDPIDGTRAFLAGRALFGTLIALTRRGKPVLGVIDQPVAGDRWLGVAGRRTLFNGMPCQARACADLAEATLATTSPDLFAPQDAPTFQALKEQARSTIYGGDCMNYALLASGFIDLVIESGLKPYDFMALIPVVVGAGGAMTDWNGRVLSLESDGRVLAVGDPMLAKVLLG